MLIYVKLYLRGILTLFTKKPVLISYLLYVKPTSYCNLSLKTLDVNPVSKKKSNGFE